MVTGEEPKQRRRRNIDGAGKYSNQTNSNQLEQIEDIFPTSQRTVDKEKSPHDFSESEMYNGYYKKFYNNQTNSSIHTFTLDKLRHFSMYSISVQACRDFTDPQFDINSFCSNVVMLNRRTEKIGSFGIHCPLKTAIINLVHDLQTMRTTLKMSPTRKSQIPTPACQWSNSLGRNRKIRTASSFHIPSSINALTWIM